MTHENCRRLLSLIARDNPMLCTFLDKKPCDCPCLPSSLSQPDWLEPDGKITKFEAEDKKSTATVAVTNDPCLARLRDLTGQVLDWPDHCPPSPPPVRVADAASSLQLAASVMGSGHSLLPV